MTRKEKSALDMLTSVVAMASKTQLAEEDKARLAKELQETITQLQAAVNARNEARQHAQRLGAGLRNIQAHASFRIGANNELGQIFFPALRDYVDEVMRPVSYRQTNTEGVSAAARWGLDFTGEPEDHEKPRRRTTY